MDELLELTNVYVVDPYILRTVASTKLAPNAPWSEDYSHTRQFLVLWAFLYINSLIVYLIFASCTFFAFFVHKRKENRDARRKEYHAVGPGGAKTANALSENPAYWPWDSSQVRNEMWVSTWSLFIMAGLTATVDMYMLVGGTAKLYKNIDDYGWGYFLASPILFLIFTDTLIYWIHRILHWPSVYWLHKLHHKYKETTPWSAFSFHPLDGFAQSVPYHLFILIFPMHSRLYSGTLLMVGLWTVNIHDRMTLRLWGVNGAAHHTIHHVKFHYNYGQYFTFWDHVFGTFKDPHLLWPYELDEEELEKQRKKEAAEMKANSAAARAALAAQAQAAGGAPVQESAPHSPNGESKKAA
jgi:lathosterol oxidase